MSEMLAQHVQESARSLLVLVNDLLHISKIEAGQMTLEHVPVDVNDIVQDVVQVVHAGVVRKGLQLSTMFDPALPQKLYCDPLLTNQILLNLVGNAVKFTHHGQISVSVSVVSQDEQTIHMKFDVLDTGIGISPEAPFSQVESGAGRRYGGTGLGLAISKRLVELMGGQIDGRLFAQAIHLRPAQTKTSPLDVDLVRRRTTCFGSVIVLRIRALARVVGGRMLRARDADRQPASVGTT